MASFRKNFAITGGANLVLAAIGVCTGILSARLLGPQGRGELAAITAFSGTISALSLIGVPNALVYYTARAPERSASYLMTSGLIAIAAAIPFALAAYLYIPHLLAHQRSGVIWAARMYLLLIAVYLFASSPGEMLRSFGYFGKWNLLRVGSQAIVLALFLVAWAASIKRAEFFALSNIAAGSLGALPLWYWLVPLLRGTPRATFEQGREVLSFALPTTLTMLSQNLNARLDQIVMSAALPAAMLGLYAAAVSWSLAAGPLSQALGVALFPRIASISDQGHRSESLARVARLTTLIALVLTIALLAATPIAIPLVFGRNFTPAVPAALVLVVAGLFFGLNMVLGEGIQGLGRPAAILRAQLAGLAVTVISLALLLKPLQIMGAAIASLLAYSTVTMVLLLQARELTGLRIMEFVRPGVPELMSCWNGVRASAASLAQVFSGEAGGSHG